MDRGKVIAWLADEELYYRDHGDTHNSLMACNALELLKEQANAYHYLQKQFFEVQNELLSQPQIVRCKNCKHRGIVEKCLLAAVSEEKDVPIFILDNRGEWFCADGERKDDG